MAEEPTYYIAHTDHGHQLHLTTDYVTNLCHTKSRKPLGLNPLEEIEIEALSHWTVGHDMCTNCMYENELRQLPRTNRTTEREA
jgi:hypothetical protein